MLRLQDKAVHPTTKKPYIKSASGGRDNSPEGLQVKRLACFASPISLLLMSVSVQNGFTHAFVMEFENEQDRDFYVKQDEAHLAFVAGLEGLVDEAQVLDYTPGKY